MDLSLSFLGALCALGSAFTWAVISLLVRTLAPYFSSVTINVARSLVGAVILLAWVLATAGPEAITGMPGRVLALLALSVIVASALGDTVFFESTKSLGLAQAMTISMTYPLMSAGLAAALIGEGITAPVLIGSLITLGGIALIVTAKAEAGLSRDRFWTGVGAALLAALAWAVSAIMLKAPLDQTDPITAQAVRLPVVTLVLLLSPWGWGSAGQIRGHGRAWVAHLLLVGALTAGSSVLFVAGLKYTGVAIATVLSSCAPMFALPLGRLFLGEPLTWRALLGTVITVLGIVVLKL